MSAEHLVAMANDIGHFFAAEPQHADAVAGIAAHIQRYWDPRMRRKILLHLQAGGAGLEPLVKEALAKVTAPPEPAKRQPAATSA